MPSQTLRYRIRIEGHVHLDWSADPDAIAIRHTDDGQTVLTVSLPDQSALHGLLMRIRDLGITLLEVRYLGKQNPARNWRSQ